MSFEINKKEESKEGFRAIRPDLAPYPFKDHNIAEKVNELRDIAIDFCHTQQLRERIAHSIVPLLKRLQEAEAKLAEISK